MQDALAITKYFDVTGNGKVNYEDFCKGLSELQAPFAEKNTRLDEVFHNVRPILSFEAL